MNVDGRGDLCAMRFLNATETWCARSRGTTALGPTAVRTTEPSFPVMPAHVAHLRPGPATQLCGECRGLGTSATLSDVCCTD